MVIGVLEQGLIYGFLALGLLITYRILDFPDLTVDGSFPLGAAVSAQLTLLGVSPWLSLLAAMGAGMLAGLITGLIHVKCKVRDLLSGIITMTGLYSVNLWIAGKPNVPLYGGETLFRNHLIDQLPPWFKPWSAIPVILLILLLTKVLLDLFLRTKAGYLLRAVGDNPSVVTVLAKDQGKVKIAGLMMANALVSLGGAVMCQHQRFFEISMGTGALVIGLASVIIGTNVLGRFHWLHSTTLVILGSIIYKGVVSVAISLGLPPVAMRLVTAALFLVILVTSQSTRRKKVPIRA